MSNRIVIEPGLRSKNYWRDLWSYRGLLYFLAWRDILVRYKQTAIGIAWSIVKPALTIAMMWFIGWLFSSNVPEGTPRVLLVALATIPWQFFSSSFSEISSSLVTNSNLLTKVYFPRLVVPLSTVIVCLVDFLISLGILIILLVAFRYMPSWQIVFLPLFVILLLLVSIGAGLFIAALNVKYRDFRYVIPFMVQFGIYVSPVAFGSEYIYQNQRVPEVCKFIYSLNPMVGVIDGFRWCFLGGSIHIYLPGFLVSIGISFFMLFLGVWYFRKTERSFADVI
ncbi:MAG TPA: ABC transporter permease [Bacteroidia bacterium]|nr:ABC transporter permease [Bacteroidia bacterium]